MKSAVIFIRYVTALTLWCVGAVSISAQSSLSTDPFIAKTLDRTNWEPGGIFYSRGSLPNRGAVISDADRFGSGPALIGVPIIQQLGRFSLQGSLVSGNFGYIARFGPHPHTEHSPFTRSYESDETKRIERPDGGQASIQVKSTFNAFHKADAYDGPQGGGYPAPTGARDDYAVSVQGYATGIYPLSTADAQKNDLSRLEIAKRAVDNAINRFTSGAKSIGNLDSESVEGALDAALSIRDALVGSVVGFLLGPEIAKLTAEAFEIGVDSFSALNPEDQYVTLDSASVVQDWADRNSLFLKAIDALATINATSALYKNLNKSGFGAIVDDIETAGAVSRASDFSISSKILKQMDERGWNMNSIDETISNADSVSPAINKVTGGEATAYFDPKGNYVVRDNATGAIIQISNKNDPNWIPDSSIINPPRKN